MMGTEEVHTDGTLSLEEKYRLLGGAVQEWNKDIQLLLNEINKDIEKIKNTIEVAVASDPSHHDRWYLERIADILGIEHESEGIPP